MYRLLRPLLFLLSPERAHHLTFSLLRVAVKLPGVVAMVGARRPQEGAATEVMGLRFASPVGLAAGMDKDARYVGEMAALGFGFVEVGTLTPVAQPGNPKPRLFRLPKDKALINRMGFNNGGVIEAAQRLRTSSGIIIGGNIGKNKSTPNEGATSDYSECLVALYPNVDYFVVNVSSPNTPGLRVLQDKEPLMELLSHLKAQGGAVARSIIPPGMTVDQQEAEVQEKPILLKIAPDLSDAQLDDVCAVVLESGIAGVVATNTTISRAGLNTPKAEVDAMGAGGLSGAPVRARSTEVIRYLRERLPRPLVIIGVGGIDSAASAMEKVEAGADLVQVYTGLIYRGPGLIAEINQAWAARRTRA